MMWSNARELKFLEAYQRESHLWNPRDVRYKDKQLLHDAWLRISNELDVPLEELKKKRDSLMATYRNHRKKVKLSLQTGAGAESVYKPIWFAYDFMDSFLHDAVTIRKTINTDTQSLPAPESPFRSRIESEITTPTENTDPNCDQSQLQTSSPLSKIPRRRKNPIELEDAGKTMRDAMSTLNTVLNKKQVTEDDYDRYGKIVANKLRKFSDTESLQIMYEIDGIFIRRINNAANASPTYYGRPSPSHTYHSEPTRQIHTPLYYARPSSACTSYSEAAGQIHTPLYCARPSSSCTSYTDPTNLYTNQSRVQIPSPATTEPPYIHIVSDQVLTPRTISLCNNNQSNDDNIITQAYYDA